MLRRDNIFQSRKYTFVSHIVEEMTESTEPLKKAPVVKVLFRFNLHSIEIFTENRDWQKLQMPGTKFRLPNMMSGTGHIFI